MGIMNPVGPVNMCKLAKVTIPPFFLERCVVVGDRCLLVLFSTLDTAATRSCDM